MAPHPLICTSDDDYVRERPRWVARLDDGTLVYADDDRPGADPPSAWLRLGAHCEASGRHVVAMWLQFRSHAVALPASRPAYFFAKAAFAVWGEGASHEGFVAGTLEDDGWVHVTRYKVPELVPMGSEVRKPADCRHFLIDCREQVDR